MIAQHNANGVAEASHEPEKGERVRTTIDEVADQPQPIRLVDRMKSDRGVV